MKAQNKFLAQVESGRNNWWTYALGFSAAVVGIIIGNILVRSVLPVIKDSYPNNPFVKDLSMTMMIGMVFGTGLLGFLLAFKFIHKRNVFSTINLSGRFNWYTYIKGFGVWAVLLFTATLLTNLDSLKHSITEFEPTHFIILFICGFVFIGIQSVFEEIILRGYLLQGMSIRIKNTIVLLLTNSLIFGFLHAGYGIESFISSWIFGLAFTMVVLRQEGIEFASGAHNAHNLFLSLLVVDLNDAVNRSFSWQIDFFELVIDIIAMVLFVFIAYKLFRKK